MISTHLKYDTGYDLLKKNIIKFMEVFGVRLGFICNIKEKKDIISFRY